MHQAFRKTRGDTILPQSSGKAPQESRLTSRVPKTTTSRVHSPPSIMSTYNVRKSSTFRVHALTSINPSLAQQSESTHYVRKSSISTFC